LGRFLGEGRVEGIVSVDMKLNGDEIDESRGVGMVGWAGAGHLAN
jgi:hypothetical protein